jgi:hypothetical protein
MAGTAFSLGIEGQIIGRAHLGRNRRDHFIIAALEHRDQSFDQPDPRFKR